jgi:hypothetical protein
MAIPAQYAAPADDARSLQPLPTVVQLVCAQSSNVMDSRSSRARWRRRRRRFPALAEGEDEGEGEQQSSARSDDYADTAVDERRLGQYGLPTEDHRFLHHGVDATEFGGRARVIEKKRAAIGAMSARVWADAVDVDGGHCAGARLAEITGVIPARALAGYQGRIRVIVRRELPHPVAQLDAFEEAGQGLHDDVDEGMCGR